MLKQYLHVVYSNGDKEIGKIWWDPEEKKLDSDNTRLLEFLKTKHYRDITYHQGPTFLQHLGRILDNGYLHAQAEDV